MSLYTELWGCGPDGTMTSNWKKAGNTKYNAGQFKAAIECYDKALEEQPTDKFLYGNRAQAHFKLNQFEEAIQDSLKSTELDPTFSKGMAETLRPGQLSDLVGGSETLRFDECLIQCL